MNNKRVVDKKKRRDKRKNKNNSSKITKAAPRDSLIVDTIREKIGEVWSKTPELLCEVMDSYEIDIYKKHLGSINQLGLERNREIVEDRLWKITEDIEKELKFILKEHSLSFWTLLEGRIKYSTYYTENRVTVVLYRKTLRAAIYKYSKVSSDDVNVDGTGVVAKEIRDEDIVALYKVDRLSYALYMMTASLRNFWKGGVINFSDDATFWTWDHNQVLEESIDWMDQRTEKFSSVLGKSGMYLECSFEKLINKRKDKIFSPFPTYLSPNIDHKVTLLEENVYKRYIKGIFLPIPNYLLFPFDFGGLFECIKPLNNHITERWGFTAEQLVQFFIVNSYRLHMAMVIKPTFGYQILMRGNLQSRKEALATDILAYAVDFNEGGHGFEFPVGDEGKKVIDSIFNAMLFKTTLDSDRDSIDLISRTGIPWMSEFDDGRIIVDYRNLLWWLDDFLHECLITASEISKEGVADIFPEIISLDLVKNINDLELVLPCNKIVKNKASEKREIDLIFRVGDVVFVCECKARRRGERKLKGERSKIITGWQDSMKDLEQVDSLSKFLGKFHTELSIPLRKGDILIPLVLYPNVTWIYGKSGENLVVGEIPRFISPQELVKYIIENKEVSFWGKDPLAVKIK